MEQLYSEYGRALRLADYEEFGGSIGGAIEAAVERALRAADADPRIPRDHDARLLLLRRGLIPWLAGIDPETGSPRRRVANRADVPEEARPLIDPWSSNGYWRPTATPQPARSRSSRRTSPCCGNGAC